MKYERRNYAIANMFAVCIVSLFALAAMPRSEWISKIGDAALDSRVLKETIERVSPDEQASFLLDVNEAISKMPASDEVKGARFYMANRAAVLGASKKKRAEVLAEVFATVPPEHLTDVNERFAVELFNRNTNPARTFTDDEFISLATNAMGTVVSRCEKAENGGVREVFAALMFLRASGGTPADLLAKLVAMIPDAKTREMATGEWIKPAMGDGQEQSYDLMLGVAQAGEEPDHAIVKRLSPLKEPLQETLLVDFKVDDVASPNMVNVAGSAYFSPDVVGSASNVGQTGISLNRIPRGNVLNKTVSANAGEAVMGKVDTVAPYNQDLGSPVVGETDSNRSWEPTLHQGQR